MFSILIVQFSLPTISTVGESAGRYAPSIFPSKWETVTKIKGLVSVGWYFQVAFLVSIKTAVALGTLIECFARWFATGIKHASTLLDVPNVSHLREPRGRRVYRPLNLEDEPRPPRLFRSVIFGVADNGAFSHAFGPTRRIELHKGNDHSTL